MRKRMLCILTALAVSATAAFGGVKEGSFSVSPMVGGYVYDGGTYLDPALVLGLRAGYNFTKSIGVEALYDYATPTDGKYGPLTKIAMQRYGGQVLYHFFPDSIFVPYLAAGYSGVKFDGNGVNKATHGAFDYGAGAKLFLTDDIAVRADLRHIMYGYDSGTYNDMEFSLGAYFQFGAVAPVVKAVASTPAPEPVKVVAAPAPESVQAVVTPAPAPAVAPVVVAAVVTPPADSDGDGVIDTLDKCPGTPKGTAVDAKGCPVETTARFCNKPAAIAISFATNKADVTAEYYKELDTVGNFLKGFPNSKGTIEGYTDASGSTATNLKLSQARAESVRSYIVKKFGIDGSRITAKGYGPAKPIASNKTAAGKAKNRRIEAVFSCE